MNQISKLMLYNLLRTTLLQIVVFSILSSLSPILCLAGVSGEINSGNSYYKDGQFDKSLDKYRDAQIREPDNPVIHYNSGDALYKMNNYDEAQGEYNKALSTNIPALKSRVLYNLGNNAYRKGDNDQALEYYKKALEVDPNDEDAKYNYEFLKNAKLNPQKNKNDKGKGKDNKDKDKDKSKQGDNKNDKDKNGQSKEDKQKMSKEDAQRILQYFDESDKNNAKKRKMSMPKMPKNEEDW